MWMIVHFDGTTIPIFNFNEMVEYVKENMPNVSVIVQCDDSVS